MAVVEIQKARENILQALRAGATRTNAARYARIHLATFYRWLQNDDEFRLEVEGAEADCELRHVTNMRLASDNGDWRASLEWLRRRRPHDWAAADRLTVKFDSMTDEQLDEYLRTCLRNAGVPTVLVGIGPDGEDCPSQLALPPPNDEDESDL